ncbi:MAG: SDR family oxidoreductase [Bacteroidota bacterium]
MILVTGATGHFGGATIDFLLKKMPAGEIAALVRDENKATELKAKGVDVRVGNYDDTASLIQAFQGVDKLLLVSGSDIMNRQKQHVAAIDAAKQAGVKHIVYTSFSRKNETETSPIGIVATAHIETDKYIKKSGIPYTLMLNGLYADVLPMFFGEKVMETGVFLPAGDGKVSYMTRREMAEAAANILSSEGHANKTYVISNTENYSLFEAADILSEIAGKKVTYLNPSAERFIEAMTNMGVPQDGIMAMSSFSEAIRVGEFETSHTDIIQLLGRAPLSLKEYLGTVYLT